MCIRDRLGAVPQRAVAEVAQGPLLDVQLLADGGDGDGCKVFADIAVSYTHLDVYKRQMMGKSSPTYSLQRLQTCSRQRKRFSRLPPYQSRRWLVTVSYTHLPYGLLLPPQ